MHGAVLPVEEPAAEKATGEDDLFHFSPHAREVYSHRVLVLNRNWQAVNVVDIKRAFALLFRMGARVIDTSEGGQSLYRVDEWIDRCMNTPPSGSDVKVIHTSRVSIRLPDVLILDDYSHLPLKEVHLTKLGILERDKRTCQYCGSKLPESDLNIDHVIPRERGGRNTWENLVTSCIRCNERKANRLPHEAGMRLLRKPVHPPRLPFAATLSADSLPNPNWKMFIGG